MALMAVTDQNFEQVIVVDESFDIFARAWPIAEMVVAARMCVRQNVKVRSKSLIAKNSGKIKDLRVEDMQASRKEDFEEILKWIDDKDAFNRRLQELIFGEHQGLIATWM